MQETLLGSAGRIDAENTETYPEIVGQWDLEMRQISPGKFHSRTEYVAVGGMLLYRTHFSLRAITTARSPKDAFMLGCARSEQPEIKWCGKSVRHDRLAFCHPGTEITAITPDRNEHVIIEVPRHLLDQILPGVDLATQLRFNHHIKTEADKSAQFIQMIDRTISAYLAQPERLSDPRECRAIELQVMDQLSDLILRHSSGEDDTYRPTRIKLLSRALDVIHHQHNPISLSELAATIETTPRTLQRAFQQGLHLAAQVPALEPDKRCPQSAAQCGQVHCNGHRYSTKLGLQGTGTFRLRVQVIIR